MYPTCSLHTLGMMRARKKLSHITCLVKPCSQKYIAIKSPVCFINDECSPRDDAQLVVVTDQIIISGQQHMELELVVALTLGVIDACDG